MRVLTYRVPPEKHGVSVGSLCRGALQLSLSRLNHVKRQDNGICLNGERVRTNIRASAGDVLQVFLDDPALSHRVPGIRYPLRVHFEDEDILIVSKPAGVAMWARDGKGESLEHYLNAYLPEDLTAHPVSRLDKGTSGLLAVAKNGYMHDLLQRRMHSQAYRRLYLAVCEGVPDPPQGEVDGPIAKVEGATVRREVRADGAPSRSVYRVLGVYGNRSLVSLTPLTGRTHQLRVHMAYLGHPMTGDFLYGTEDPQLISRPALHSAELVLTHPLTGEKMRWTEPLPEDMQRLLE